MFEQFNVDKLLYSIVYIIIAAVLYKLAPK